MDNIHSHVGDTSLYNVAILIQMIKLLLYNYLRVLIHA